MDEEGAVAVGVVVVKEVFYGGFEGEDALSEAASGFFVDSAAVELDFAEEGGAEGGFAGAGGSCDDDCAVGVVCVLGDGVGGTVFVGESDVVGE